MLQWKINEVYFVERINYLSLHKISTPPLSIWSLPAGLLCVLLHHNWHSERISQNIKVFSSCPQLPLFLHFGVFVSQTRTHMHTSAPTPPPPPPPPLCLCMRPLPRSHCHVNYLFALFCSKPTIYQSVSQLFISHSASLPVIRFGWGRRWILLAPCRGKRRH